MITHPKILGLTLDPKLTYNRHIDLAVTKAHTTINILKVLTLTKWSKHKETMLVTYTYLRIATGCTNTYNFTPEIRQKAEHPLHKLRIHPYVPRLEKQSTFNYTTNIDTHPNTVTQQQTTANSPQIHSSIVQTHILQHNHNKLIH